MTCVLGVAATSFVAGIVCRHKMGRDRVEVHGNATPTNGSLKIDYLQDGNTASVLVPYTVDNVILAQEYRVYLSSRGQVTDITHDPAIPYAYSAFELSGDPEAYFTVVDQEDGRSMSPVDNPTQCFKDMAE